MIWEDAGQAATGGIKNSNTSNSCHAQSGCGYEGLSKDAPPPSNLDGGGATLRKDILPLRGKKP